MKLGDLDALKESLNFVYDCDYIGSKSIEGVVSDIIEEIDNAPTVPLPDIIDGYTQAILDGKTNFSKPQGVWIIRTEDNGVNYRFYCSCCRREVIQITDYCPSCGAYMYMWKESEK